MSDFQEIAPKRDLARWLSAARAHGVPVTQDMDGVAWFDAPAPRRWHRCWPQTSGYTGGTLGFVERCACGGIRVGRSGPWMERNSKGRTRPKTLAEWVELHKDLQAMTLQQWINRRRK